MTARRYVQGFSQPYPFIGKKSKITRNKLNEAVKINADLSLVNSATRAKASIECTRLLVGRHGEMERGPVINFTMANNIVQLGH